MSQPGIDNVQQALRARLRFERELGLESLARTPLVMRAPQPAAAPAPASISTSPEKKSEPRNIPAAPAPLAAVVQEEHAPAVDKEARWAAIEAEAKICSKCSLHSGRTHVVFGEGDRNAKLVFVGEGPGADEDASGRPFVGKAGQLLEKIIAAMNMRRSEIYICNTVKCRPPENRTPLPDEITACWPYLEEQLSLISPKVIVALGSPAAKTLLKTTQGIMAIRGRWQLYKGIRVMPTYHPAFVLRQYTEKVRSEVWGDMQLVMNYLKETAGT